MWNPPAKRSYINNCHDQNFTNFRTHTHTHIRDHFPHDFLGFRNHGRHGPTIFHPFSGAAEVRRGGESRVFLDEMLRGETGQRATHPPGADSKPLGLRGVEGWLGWLQQGEAARLLGEESWAQEEIEGGIYFLVGFIDRKWRQNCLLTHSSFSSLPFFGFRLGD